MGNFFCSRYEKLCPFPADAHFILQRWNLSARSNVGGSSSEGTITCKAIKVIEFFKIPFIQISIFIEQILSETEEQNYSGNFRFKSNFLRADKTKVVSLNFARKRSFLSQDYDY